jgi:16S rRNA (uracil1498-N3)-methyltransferase
MAMRRFYIDPEARHDAQVVIRGDLFHHIRDVCRFSEKDRFEVLVGDGLARLVEVQSIGPREIIAVILSERPTPALNKPYLTIALAVPKLPKVDWIIEKCVELGVYEIRPFVSEYSFLRKISDISPARVQRWQKLVTSATQQTGRGELMRIAAPTTLKALLSEFNQKSLTGGLFPYEGEAQTGLRQALQDLRLSALDHLWVFVGSEGGFSRSEVGLFAVAGLHPVTLGEQILRVETACVALASIIKYETGSAGIVTKLGES